MRSVVPSCKGITVKQRNAKSSTSSTASSVSLLTKSQGPPSEDATPRLARALGRAVTRVAAGFLLWEDEPVPAHAAVVGIRVVVEPCASRRRGDDTVRDELDQETAYAAVSSIDGGVLQAASRVGGPVVHGGRRGRLGSGLGALRRVLESRELEELVGS